MNKNLFSTERKSSLIQNEAGGTAYAFGPEHALAQFASTGFLNNTYYSSGEEQLEKTVELLKAVSPEFAAKTAIYARESGFMKDMPAVICAWLASRDVKLLATVFDRVIDNGKMLRNFVQAVRSGKLGRKSFGTAPKKLVQKWFADRTADDILRASVGTNPSLADVIKLCHPHPENRGKDALYAWLLGKEERKAGAPSLLRDLEAFRAGKTNEVPEVPFMLLTSNDLSKEQWTEIAKHASWTTTRMNLNTFQRHGVLKDRKLVWMLAARLRDPDEIKGSRCFPYQLMAAYLNVNDQVPHEIKEALQDAMEVAIENVPTIDGHVYVFPDVSGSMSNPVTGDRGGGTSKMRCIDVAALVAASIMRKNPQTVVLPFEEDVVDKLRLNPRDSVMTNAEKLSKIGGGGTNCSAPLHRLLATNAKVDLCIFVSDNESWVDSQEHFYSRETATIHFWDEIRKSNPKARLVCIDLQAYGSTQAKERQDIFNIGGFSDNVFSLVSLFAKGKLDHGNHWVEAIEAVKL